jgi:hypothetical protein
VGDGVNCATCGSTTASPLTISSIGASSFVFNGTASDSAVHTITTFHQSSLRSGVGAVTPQTVTFWLKQPNGFDHNVYFSENNTNSNNLYGVLNYRGNISSYDGIGTTQMRPGGNIQDNAFIRNEVGHNFGSFTVQASTITGNVHLSGQLWGGSCCATGFVTSGTAYNGQASGLGTYSITQNVFANGADASMDPNSYGSGHSVIITNNVMYNWNASSDYTGNTGGIKTAHITTAGSGFTDNVWDATAITANSDGGADLTITQDTSIAFGVDIYSSFWVTGLTGGSCNVNGVLYYAQISGAHTLHLYSPASATGCSVVGAVKVYYPALATVPSFTGGTGSGATTQIISVGGALVALNLFGAEGVLPQPGQGYVAGDNLGLSIGSGAVIRVDSVSTATVNSNAFDPTGSNPGIYAGCSAPSSATSPNTCTPAKYYDHLLGSAGHTDLDFLNAAINNFKGNWNPALTANNGLVPFVQAGFAPAGGGGVRGLSLGKSLSIVPLLDWLFRPANDNKPRAFRKAA